MSPRPMSPRPNNPPLDRPQPEQLEQRPEPEQPDEEAKPWVRKPFDPVIKNYKIVKSRYNSMERFIEAISSYLDSEPADVLDRIKALPKPQDLTDLQARMDCLLRENGELRAKADEGDALRKEVEDLKNRIKAAKKEVKTARQSGISRRRWPRRYTGSWRIRATCSTRHDFSTTA